MGRITSSIGLISGIPIVQTVDQLMALEARPRDLLISLNDRLGSEQIAITDISARLLAVQFGVSTLGLKSTFEQRSVTSSNESLLTATVTGTPALGSFQFTPLQLAQSQQLLSSGFTSNSAPLTAGSFSFRFGGFVNQDTTLDILDGGEGFARGKIRITDRSGASAEIDLRFARTVDDVLRTINNNTAINVRAEAQGDRFRLVDQTGLSLANLKVDEVGGGTTAASLGLAGIDVAASTALGADVVRLYDDLALTELNDGRGVRVDRFLPDLEVTFRDGSSPLQIDFNRLALPGTKAAATTTAANGLPAQVKFTAVQAGTQFDGVTVIFEHDGDVTAGSETVEYDEIAGTLTFKIEAGATRANDVIAALNNDADANQYFTAEPATGSDGTGLIDVTDTAVTSGGVDPLEARHETTLGEILQTINETDPTRLLAEISPDGDRIILTDLTADTGGTFSVQSLNGSRAAYDLGLTGAAQSGVITGTRILSGLNTSLLSSLGGGQGLGELGTLGLTDRSGASTMVDLSTAETIADVIAAINASGIGISASVNDARNGIVLSDTTGATASNLIVENADATDTADKLQIAVDAAVGSTNSGDLKLQVISENTRLSSLGGGKGVAKGTLTITDTNNKKAVLDLSKGTFNTIGDVLIELGRLGLAIMARINDAGDGILLIDTAGGAGQLKVTEGNTSTAADLGLLREATTIDIGGTPTLVIDGSTTRLVELDGSESLTDLVQKINDLNVGITATTFNDGSSSKPFRLLLTSQRAGGRGELLIDTSNVGFSFEQNVRAQDAVLLFGSSSDAVLGALAASSSNTFNSVLPGVSLTLKNASQEAVTVNISTTDTMLVTAVEKFVADYNQLRLRLGEVTAFNPETGERGVLLGDLGALRVDTDFANLLSGLFHGAGPIRSLETIGIRLKDDGTLDFDAEKLKARFAEDPNGVRDFFTTKETGFVDRVKKLANQLAGEENSLLVNRIESLARRITDNNERIEFFDVSLERKRERLLESFIRMERAIAELQNQLNAIQSIVPVPPLSSVRRNI